MWHVPPRCPSLHTTPNDQATLTDFYLKAGSQEMLSERSYGRFQDVLCEYSLNVIAKISANVRYKYSLNVPIEGSRNVLCKCSLNVTAKSSLNIPFERSWNVPDVSSSFSYNRRVNFTKKFRFHTSRPGIRCTTLLCKSPFWFCLWSSCSQAKKCRSVTLGFNSLICDIMWTKILI